MTELLNCPFCGRKAHTANKYMIWTNSESAVCTNCGAVICRDTEAEAIAAWNTRVDTEYGAIPATEENMAAHGWVRERTCKVAASYDTSDVDNRGSNAEWYFAFTCGCELYWDEAKPPNYCPNCGAKVVE